MYGLRILVSVLTVSTVADPEEIRVGNASVERERRESSVPCWIFHDVSRYLGIHHGMWAARRMPREPGTTYIYIYIMLYIYMFKIHVYVYYICITEKQRAREKYSSGMLPHPIPCLATRVSRLLLLLFHEDACVFRFHTLETRLPPSILWCGRSVVFVHVLVPGGTTFWGVLMSSLKGFGSRLHDINDQCSPNGRICSTRVP